MGRDPSLACFHKYKVDLLYKIAMDIRYIRGLLPDEVIYTEDMDFKPKIAIRNRTNGRKLG